MGFFDPFGGSGGSGGSGGTVAPGNYATKAELNSEAEKRASDDKELQNEIKANTESISNLVAETESINQSVSGLENSVEELQTNKANTADVYNKDETDNAITAKVAEIVAGAPEEFNTLKEMSDWLTEHEDSAATMNTAILKNKEDIAANTEAIEQNKSDIEQNKSDILSLEENKMPLKRGYVSPNGAGSGKWFKMASTIVPRKATSENIAFLICDRFHVFFGILLIGTRYELDSNDHINWINSTPTATWLSVDNTVEKANNFRILANYENSTFNVELWVNIPQLWGAINYEVLMENSTGGSKSNNWVLYTSTAPYDTLPDSPKSVTPSDPITERFKAIETKIAALETALSQTQTE